MDLCGVALLAMLALASCGATADTDADRKRFRIASQPAAAALNEFARQADITLVFSYDLVQDAKIRPLSGRYTVNEGLARLLEGSGLGYRKLGRATFTICDRRTCGAKTQAAPPVACADARRPAAKPACAAQWWKSASAPSL
jgi:hypothetical protein